MNDRRLVILLLGVVTIVAVVGSIGLAALDKSFEAVTNLAFSSAGALAGLLAPRGDAVNITAQPPGSDDATRSAITEFMRQTGMMKEGS